MASKEQSTDTSMASTMAKLMPAELFEIGQKRAEALMDFQKELFATFEKTNKDWLERMKLEADLTSKLTRPTRSGWGNAWTC
jgi:hypothetical protein